MIPPGIRGLDCPTDLSSYVPDAEKDDNQWVRVGAGGCVEVVDGTTMSWTTTDHCGLDEFAGWCWLDNVSKDEYAGHIFALGAVWRLVDDAAIRAEAASMLAESAHHLIDNDLAFTDWDGRLTEHGRLYATALDGFPGFNAAMVLALFGTASAASGDAEIDRYYRECLLGNPRDCLPYDTERPRPYTERFNQSGIYVGADDCESNFNNIGMHILSLHDLAWFAGEPTLLDAVQQSLDEDVFRAEGHPRASLQQHNVWFDFIWASMKAQGPGPDGAALSAVRDGICMLRQFPARCDQPTLDAPPRLTEACLDRRGNPVAAEPRQAAERCPSTYVWWGDPYRLDGCVEDPKRIRPPQSYLLPYWMGRYYGFIDAAL